jgi:predicted ArsR family transcriptional regulator
MKSKITTARKSHAMSLYALLKTGKPYKLSQIARKLMISTHSVKAALAQVRADGHNVRCEGSGERGNPCYWLDEAEAHRYQMRNEPLA